MSKVAVAFALCTVFVLPIAAQQGRGTILGIITDPAGASVAGATVSVVNTETNIAVTVQTNAEGYYTSSALIVGIAQSYPFNFRRPVQGRTNGGPVRGN